jgi:hypothetical protein
MATDILSQLGTYALFGAVASYLVQITKSWLETKDEKIIWTAIVCIAISIVIYLANWIPESIIEISVGIFATAETIYALYFKDK